MELYNNKKTHLDIFAGSQFYLRVVFPVYKFKCLWEFPPKAAAHVQCMNVADVVKIELPSNC